MIESASHWKTNGHLIAEAALPLGYLKTTDRIVDPTYGMGVWWDEWPGFTGNGELVASDLNPKKSPVGYPVDFTAMPWAASEFDAATYDPPYCATGSKETSTTKDHNARYGRDTVDSSAEAVQELMHRGLAECSRVVKPGGFILAKAQQYVWSGNLWEGDVLIRNYAVHQLGLAVQDRFHMVGRPGPQPKLSVCIQCGHKIRRRTTGRWDRMQRKGQDNTVCPGHDWGHQPDPDVLGQEHAASNQSTLYVFENTK